MPALRTRDELGISIPGFSSPESDLIIAHVPSLSGAEFVETDDFGPYQYSHLILVPKFSTTLDNADVAIRNSSPGCEPVDVQPGHKAGWIYSKEYEVYFANPVEEIRIIQGKLEYDLKKEGANITRLNGEPEAYGPCMYVPKDQEPTAMSVARISLIELVDDNTRKLIRNYQLGDKK